MQEFRLLQHLLWIPALVFVAKVCSVLTLRAEFASQEVVAPMRDDHAVFAIQIVDDFHIEVAMSSLVNCVFNTLEFLDGGLNEHKLRAKVWFVQPVSTGHGDGTKRKEEELIHMLENGRIRIKG
jgi:hypothetical protein